MALDHALASELGDGQAVLRLYSWTRPTVSFGRNEPAREAYASGPPRGEGEGRRRDAELAFVRRPTGGRAVLHDAEVTYAVVAPIRPLGGVRNAYRMINEALVAALASLGAPVAVAAGGPVEPVDAGPCFQGAADGEVMLADRKVVGSAQARVDGALLQHGSIILSGDPAPPRRHRSKSVADGLDGEGRDRCPDGSGRPAALTDLLPGIGFGQVAAAVVDQMRETFDGIWQSGEYRRAELAAARRLTDERYGTDAWTWRR